MLTSLYIIQLFSDNKIGDTMIYMSNDYEINKLKFKDDFRDCSDFLLKEIEIGDKRAFVCVMDGLVDSLQLGQMIAEPLLKTDMSLCGELEPLEIIKKRLVQCAEQNEAATFDDAYYFLMSGFAVLVVEGCSRALAFGIQGWTRRDTSEPKTEANVKGAKECFVESINDNKALLRKRLKTPHLKQKQLKLGKAAQTPVAICYLDDRADMSAVSEIEKRLNEANFNTVLDYGEALAFIGTRRKSFFTTVGNTERPDVLASKLLEGRVAVMIEGTPFVIYTPYLFSDNFSASDDYDNPPFFASFMRVLRYFAFLTSLFLPGVFVAVDTFHQELIPTNLLYLIATNEATTPFSLMTEAILVHLLYEIMREGGLRLPESVGHAVSIIGAIVIGDAAVSAGVIGAPMLIIVAVTAVSSYVVYPLYESLAVLRILFIIIGGTTGIYGIMLFGGMLFCNICSLNAYGVAYSSPFSPLTASSIKDTLVRTSWTKLAKRRIRLYSLKGANKNDRG